MPCVTDVGDVGLFFGSVNLRFALPQLSQNAPKVLLYKKRHLRGSFSSITPPHLQWPISAVARIEARPHTRLREKK